jgi:DDE superfamily endonuclease/Helix-turn-helix of DDE superfamily endonuclease
MKQEGQIPVYRLPGLSLRAAELVVELAAEAFPDWTPKVGRRPKLDVVEALRLCLCWLRRNMTFEELGEDFGIGTTTAWEYAHGMAEFLAEAIGCPVESLKDQIAGKVCLVDGTLIPTCNWRHRRDLHSGHRKRYGVNVQIVCDLYGRVNACTHAFPGSWHDKRCVDEAGLATILTGCGGLVADSGYQGIDGVIPIKGKPGRKLTDEEHRFNAQVASIRFVVEQAIAHMKNWRITTTRYRGHLDRINNVILTAVGLQALNDQLSDRALSLTRLTQK